MTDRGTSRPEGRPGHAVILMYHRVRLEGALPVEGDYALPSDLFARHVRGLASPGRRVVSLDELASGLPPGRSVVLTFDDGCDSDEAVALPLLQEWGLAGAFFVSPALVGQPGHLDWPGVRRLADAGMHVGSHGLDHTLLGDLARSDLDRQLTESRRMLEDRLDRSVDTLALPGGSGDRRVVRRAMELGYRLVLGSRPGRLRGPVPGEALPRYAVRRGHGAARIEALADHRLGPRISARLRYLLTQVLRRGLGNSIYGRARERVVSPPNPPPGEGRAR